MTKKNTKETAILFMNKTVGVECWAFIANTEDRYAVTTDGVVYSLYHANCARPGWMKVPHELKPQMCGGSNTGKFRYSTVKLAGHKFMTYIHRIVAQTFIPNPEGKRCVDHVNGNHNDNRVTNLRWVTHEENSNMPITRERAARVILERRVAELEALLLLQNDAKVGQV